MQLGFVLVGFAPAIASLLTARDPMNWMLVAIIVAVVNLVALISVATAKESVHIKLENLGK